MTKGEIRAARMTRLWTDPSGRVREVQVIEERAKTATITYFDNARRGTRYVAGRRYSHGTRVTLNVYRTELR